jgi:hypothetical protein
LETSQMLINYRICKYIVVYNIAQKNEKWPLHTTTWIDLTRLIESKRSQTQKCIFYDSLRNIL